MLHCSVCLIRYHTNASTTTIFCLLPVLNRLEHSIVGAPQIIPVTHIASTMMRRINSHQLFVERYAFFPPRLSIIPIHCPLVTVWMVIGTGLCSFAIYVQK